MKYIAITLLVFAFCLTSGIKAQIDVFGKLKEKAEQRAEEKVDEAIDKGLDKAEEEVTKDRSKKKKQDSEEASAEESESESSDESEDTPKTKTVKTSSSAADNSVSKDAGLKSYSKFDFVPGEKVIFFDDFSQDNVGDFPARWNTNGRGEVVKLNNYEGNWFKLFNQATYMPELVSSQMPSDFTIEFDMIVNGEDNGGDNLGDVMLDLYNLENPDIVPDASSEPQGTGAQITARFAYSGKNSFFTTNFVRNGNNVIVNTIQSDISDNVLAGKTGQKFRVSFAVNKQRLRMYLNEKKVLDIPKLLPQEQLNSFFIRNWYWDEETDYQILITNFRYAEGTPDMRSKLMKEGKLVTRGILFDSGSDKIKAESYGTLKEIAGVLKENSTVKVKIIGHTDSDGNDAANLELSKKRSAAVKNALSAEFGIDASRMETDGKGESEPASDNNSSEGKANNRRVEFIKL